MASANRSGRTLRDQYLQPPSEPGVQASQPSAQEQDLAARRKVAATVYDAVAGRVGYESFPTRFRDRNSTSQIAVPPDEVLFRRKNAPVRYEEDDIYAADRHLKPQQRLPESELLKEIHTYVSDFYGSHDPGSGSDVSFKSFDETALITIGILLEEAAKESLGKTGDLALVEAEDDGLEHADERYWPGVGAKRKVIGKERKRPSSMKAEDVEVEAMDERIDDG